MTINEFAAGMQKSNKEINWSQYMDVATSGNPPCMLSVQVLAKYCRLYSGGEGAPVIISLDKFHKKHCSNARLGEEFWTAVTDFSCTGSLCPVPWVRSAMLACQLTAARRMDGISKLLTATDIRKLNSKANAPKVLELEKSLSTCKELVTQVGDQHGEDAYQKVHDAFMLLQIRCIAHLCGKGNLTFEGISFENINEILKHFFSC